MFSYTLLKFNLCARVAQAPPRRHCYKLFSSHVWSLSVLNYLLFYYKTTISKNNIGHQARSQACLPGVANFHMVQNLRAYFILYVITIKCKKYMQDRIEFSCMLQRKKVNLNQNFRMSLLGYKDKATIKNC